MSIYMKHLPIAIALFLGTSQLSASLARQNQDISERMTALEQESADKARVSPTVKHCNDFFVTGDYLFMHVNQSGTAYAVKVEDTVSNKGKVKNLDFGWDSGFRVGLGYRMPHDKWELAVNWTRFYTDAHDRVNSDGQVIFPEWAIQTPAGVSSIDAKWKMRLNIVDGDISRYFMVTPKLAFKPRFGIRGAWLTQKYELDQDGTVSNNSEMKNDFSGVGLRAGLETEWDIDRNWSIYGDAAYSLIYGNFELRQEIDNATPGNNLNIRDHFQDLVGMAELGVGIRWDYTFSNDWTALRIQAGWEFNAYFNQNRFEHFNSNESSRLSFIANNNDLTLQGLVVSGRIDF